ncbi:XRE family transcriptional regulator [Kineococcus sp. NBC_00420]|uniref:helix-turn-helix domain-containing protein n=1 Tax=Kineococcus sp. NBC_00420 TaxID=2903564 RepID=UPI002E1A47AE
MRQTGDVILTVRRALGLTQDDLCEQLGVTQATLSRYEHNEREPDEAMLEKLGAALGVSVPFLKHPFKLQGAIAADAHMRRQKTVKASDWKRLEAQLNMLRMRSAFLLARVSIDAENQVPSFDPIDTAPEQAARMVRAQWRMPIGPVRNLTRWLEAAGILVMQQDFGTQRIDGACQWAAANPVVLINEGLPTDRRRWTLAHELGHLVLHSQYVDEDMEKQADAFAGEFLMPEHLIKSPLRNQSIPRLLELKVEWGVSMQALFMRAVALKLATREDQTQFFKMMNARGWKRQEPGADRLPDEQPALVASIGDRLREAGLSDDKIGQLTGARGHEGARPFVHPRTRLQAV